MEEMFSRNLRERLVTWLNIGQLRGHFLNPIQSNECKHVRCMLNEYGDDDDKFH